MLATRPTTNKTDRFSLSRRHFEALRALLREHAGISLHDNQADLLQARLMRRLGALGLSGFGAYLALLSSPAGRFEMAHFISALTTNLTGFFREPHHFDFLARVALPEAVQRHALDRHLRFWSAGCSTGEEAWSMAIVLQESAPALQGFDARVFATDLDRLALTQARRGRYDASRIADLSRSRSRWFRRGSDGVRVVPELRERVSFHQLNLVQDWPDTGQFDLIMCRNVLIYFDRRTRNRLCERFAGCLAHGGYLCVGHSEDLRDCSDRFEAVGQTIYRKIR